MTIRPEVTRWLAATMVAGMAAASLAGAARARQAPADAGQLKLGKQVYAGSCVECHGKRGEGNGPEAHRKGYHPRNFTLGAFRCRCTPTGAPPTDQDLLRTVTNGLPGTPMPAFVNLSLKERAAVIQYVKTLSPKAFADGNEASCPTAPDPPADSAELTAEGKQLYKLMQCAKCHGASGRGDGPSAATLKDDWGQPIKPDNFVSDSRFKCGSTDADLFRTLQTGMTGAPMPSFVQALGFGREAFPAAVVRALDGTNEVAEILQYLDQQPTIAEMRGMSDAERRERVNRRAWAIVRHLRSLAASSPSRPPP